MKNSKLKYFSLLAALAWSAVWADNDNTLSFSNTILMPGTTANIELRMMNTATNLTCVEAEIELPEGLTVVCDENGDPTVTLIRNRSTEHEVLTNVLDNGNFKLLISSIDGAVFRGNEGPLLSFSVQADIDAPTGEYTIGTVGESLLVNTNAEAFYTVGVTGNVLITDDPTRITTTDNGQQTTDDKIYNLAGQRLGKKQKGINIVNGRKVIQK